MGKAEGREENWHGHVTAVSVAPEHRRMRLAARFMQNLEQISESKCCYFVDLFVRVSNLVAHRMYSDLGYVVYRRIIDYYSGEQDEDAFGERLLAGQCVKAGRLDMRKALSRDALRKSVVPLKNPVKCSDIEFD